MSAIAAPPVPITATYFNQSVYLNIQTILNNVIKAASQAKAETLHELGLSGMGLNSTDANGTPTHSYDGWAMANGAPQMAEGAWNWYLQNKILGGKAPLNMAQRICKRKTGLHHPTIVCTTNRIDPQTASGGPYPKIGDLNLIVNNLMMYADNLLTELNRIHLPTPSNFMGWINAIQQYAQTSVYGLQLVSLYNSLVGINAWLPTVQHNLAAKKQADAVAAQQAAAAQASAAQAAALKARTEAAAAQAALIAEQQKAAQQKAQQLAASATQAATTHAAQGDTPAATTAATVASVAGQAAQTLAVASQLSQVASATPTPNNINAAAQAGHAAVSAVDAVNSATGKKTSVIPLLLIAGGVALKAAGIAL